MLPIQTSDDHQFRDGDQASGVLGTPVNAQWLNAVQAELLSVIAAGGVTPAVDTTQVRQAISALIAGALQSYPTTVSVNEALTAKAPIDRGVGHALDLRGTESQPPSFWINKGRHVGFMGYSGLGLPLTTSAYYNVEVDSHWNDASVVITQCATNGIEQYTRASVSESAWSAWVRVWDSSNFDPSTLAKSTPTSIIGQDVNGIVTSGRYIGYNLGNSPDYANWSLLVVDSNIGDQIFQTITVASYAGGKSYKRGSSNYGASWSGWVPVVDAANPSTTGVLNHTGRGGISDYLSVATSNSNEDHGFGFSVGFGALTGW